MEENLYDMFYGASWTTHMKARNLRKKETKAEKVLWNFICNKKLGVKFRRQHPISQFIADFYCHELKLVIEVDGGIHLQEDNMEYDKMRTTAFNYYGIRVIRFTNEEVIQSPEEVISTIKNWINKLTPKSPEGDF
jgi:very-short-patch-repair endonuclease